MPPLQKFPYGPWHKAPVPDMAMLEEQYWHLASDCYSTELNLGVRTGQWSIPAEGRGLLIVDVDLRSKAHTEECQALVERLLGDVSQFPYVASGRGMGGHYHMSCPLDQLPSSAATTVASRYDGDSKLYVVEILSTQKQVVLPPSRHPETRQEYVWQDGIPERLP